MNTEDTKTFESIGMNIRRLRKERGLTQKQLADKSGIERTTIIRYESGKLTPTPLNIDILEQTFELEKGALARKTAIAIPDSSALLKNRRLLEFLISDYEIVIIPDVVQNELSGIKNMRITDDSPVEERKNKKTASQLMSTILEYLEKGDKVKRLDTSKYDVSFYNDQSKNDGRIIELAKDVQRKRSRPVYIIHVDKDIPSLGGDEIHALYLDDYMANRSNSETNMQDIKYLDSAYNHLERFDVAAKRMNLDTYLSDGMTLLISCLRCNEPNKLKERDGQPIPEELMRKKLKFLLDHGADPDLTDSYQYCHTPLEHCIERYPSDIEAFRILLNYGADYNKGSLDQTKKRDKRLSAINEGNTPLMIACWLGREEFVDELLKKEDLSVNQQDCNGYTALIKCAVKRYKQIENESKYDRYERLYYKLLKNSAVDQKIRDRNNKTAHDWWVAGDELLKKKQSDNQ